MPYSVRNTALALAALLALTAGCKKTPAPPAPVPAAQPLAKVAPATDPALAAREVAFVQSFYDWYDPLAHDDKLSDAASKVAFKRRPDFFDAPLLAALRNDAAIQAKAVGEIDGLDYDPFGYGQDPTGISFQAIKATGSRVTVYSCSEAKQCSPEDGLEMEVRCDTSHCVLVNVFYPGTPANPPQEAIPPYDLLSELRELHPTTH